MRACVCVYVCKGLVCRWRRTYTHILWYPHSLSFFVSLTLFLVSHAQSWYWYSMVYRACILRIIRGNRQGFVHCPPRNLLQALRGQQLAENWASRRADRKHSISERCQERLEAGKGGRKLRAGLPGDTSEVYGQADRGCSAYCEAARGRGSGEARPRSDEAAG